MVQEKTRMLESGEERALFDAYLDHGDIAARNKLVSAYMPMAKRAAAKHAARGNTGRDDLVQEAVVALTSAIDKFDRSKGVRLSTFAAFYIRSALMRYIMDHHSVARVGTNLPDKRVFMNLRRLMADIQARNGGKDITDSDRQDIATTLNVTLETVKRMEPRVFANDIPIQHTDQSEEGDDGKIVSSRGVIAVNGEQSEVERSMDQGDIMARIHDIVQRNYNGRDLEIVMARIEGDMTRPKFDDLKARYAISVERIRQIQRGALQVIMDNLARDGITSTDQIAL